MTDAELTAYPALYAAWQQIHPLLSHKLNDTYLAFLYDNGWSLQLAAVEACLVTLSSRTNDLKESLTFVFASTTNQGAHKFEAGYTELLTFAYLEKCSVLDEIGYPSGGGSAGFEGRLCDINASNNPICFDVKSAVGGGMSLLQDRLDNIVKKWQKTIGLSNRAAFLNLQGSLTQTQVGSNQGNNEIVRYEQLLSKRKRQFYYSHVLRFQNLGAKETKVRVMVRDETRMNANMPYWGGTIQAKEVKDVFAKHIASKASKHQMPFLLFYVKPFLQPLGDISPSVLPYATAMLEADRTAGILKDNGLWLGVILLDFTTNGQVQTSSYLSPTGGWPSPSTIATLKKTLGL